MSNYFGIYNTCWRGFGRVSSKLEKNNEKSIDYALVSGDTTRFPMLPLQRSCYETYT
jgi:hypothetical protein